MFIFKTTEIRWFIRRQIPLIVNEWFDKCPGDWYAEPERTDSYYRLAESNFLGIKLRQGRIEIKERTSSPELLRIQKDVFGMIEAWRKEGFELAGPPEIDTGDPSYEQSWLPVKKSRKVLIYGLSSDGALISQDLDQGVVCKVELTSVLVQNDHWWSLGFEVSGVETNQKEVLLAVTTGLFKLAKDIRLPEDDSMGYPEWLRRIL